MNASTQTGSRRAGSQRTSGERTGGQRTAGQRTAGRGTGSRTGGAPRHLPPPVDHLDERPGRTLAIEIAMVRGWAAVRAATARAWEVANALVTPAGWMVAIWAVLGLAVGLALGWSEFLIGGALAIVLLLAAVPFLLGHAPYRVSFTLESDAVVVGHDAEGEIVVNNAGARIALPGRVDVPVGDGLIDFHVPLLRRGHEHREAIVIPARRRGVVQVGPATTTRADLLRLLRREFRWEDVRTLYIHPATITVPSTSMGVVRDLEGRSTRTVTSEDISFHAVREYARGDARRHVHWKSTAKTGRLMVRQFEETRRSTLALVLDLDALSYGSEAEFEMAVSAVGSLGVRAVRDGRDVQVIVSGEVPEFARASLRSLRRLRVTTSRALLDELAGVEVATSVVPLSTLTRMVDDATTDTSLAILVTGSALSLSQMQAAALAFPVDVAVAAVVCNPEAEPSIRALSSMRVLTLGVLGDLRELLARGASE